MHSAGAPHHREGPPDRDAPRVAAGAQLPAPEGSSTGAHRSSVTIGSPRRSLASGGGACDSGWSRRSADLADGASNSGVAGFGPSERSPREASEARRVPFVQSASAATPRDVFFVCFVKRLDARDGNFALPTQSTVCRGSGLTRCGRPRARIAARASERRLLGHWGFRGGVCLDRAALGRVAGTIFRLYR